MLILEAWNGSGWKQFGKIEDGTQRVILNHAHDHDQLLHVIAETERTIIALADEQEHKLELKVGDTWEVLLHTDRMSARTLCRFRHEPKATYDTLPKQRAKPKKKAIS